MDQQTIYVSPPFYPEPVAQSALPPRQRRRLGRISRTALYLLVFGSLFCGLLYPLAMRGYDMRTASLAAALPDYSQMVPPTPWAVGRPLKIEIPSLGMSLAVTDGTYDAATKTWTVSQDKTHFDTSSTLPNSRSGNTFIYGHATNAVFGPLLKIQPEATAIITTDSGFVFTYKLTHHQVVDPSDTSVLTYSGPSRLMLQTCTGPTLSEYRQLFYFNYIDHRRV